VVEVELEDDSLRTARRFFADGTRVRLEAIGEPLEPLEVDADQVMVMGVIAARLKFADTGADPVEEPLMPQPSA